FGAGQRNHGAVQEAQRSRDDDHSSDALRRQRGVRIARDSLARWMDRRRLAIKVEERMGKTDVWQGTLALMILKTLETMGPQHGYGIARRIEQTSGHKLLVNYGTLYPALLKLEQEGYIKSSWGVSDNNRKAKFYQLTRAGKKQVAREAREWNETTAILARFLSPDEV